MNPATGERAVPDRGSYWLTRFTILRLLGLVYAIAFLVAANQILPLIGSDGLLAVSNFLDKVREALGGSLGGFLPDAFALLVERLRHRSPHDGVDRRCAFLGSACGYANALLLAVLWALYMSFVHVGQDWYGYGWEV